MPSVLCRAAGRGALILALAGMVGSVAGSAVPASAATGRPATVDKRMTTVQIGTAVAYVREPNGTIRQIRGQ
jgi:hypothetical protein